MKKVLMIIIAFLIFIISCTPSPEAIQRAIAKTQTALPTNTPTSTSTPTPTSTPTSTPIPLSQINLASYLLLKGDLPDGWTVEPLITDILETSYAQNLGQVNFIAQRFSKVNTGIGSVSVLLFDEINKRDNTYKLQRDELVDITRKLGTTDIINLPDIGEKGELFINAFYNQRDSFLIFGRCHAFVYAAMSNDDELSSALKSYTKKLDSRLTNVVCQ